MFNPFSAIEKATDLFGFELLSQKKQLGNVWAVSVVDSPYEVPAFLHPREGDPSNVATEKVCCSILRCLYLLGAVGKKKATRPARVVADPLVGQYFDESSLMEYVRNWKDRIYSTAAPPLLWAMSLPPALSGGHMPAASVPALSVSPRSSPLGLVPRSSPPPPPAAPAALPSVCTYASSQMLLQKPLFGAPSVPSLKPQQKMPQWPAHVSPHVLAHTPQAAPLLLSPAAKELSIGDFFESAPFEPRASPHGFVQVVSHFSARAFARLKGGDGGFVEFHPHGGALALVCGASLRELDNTACAVAASALSAPNTAPRVLCVSLTAGAVVPAAFEQCLSLRCPSKGGTFEALLDDESATFGVRLGPALFQDHQCVALTGLPTTAVVADMLAALREFHAGVVIADLGYWDDTHDLNILIAALVNKARTLPVIVKTAVQPCAHLVNVAQLVVAHTFFDHKPIRALMRNVLKANAGMSLTEHEALLATSTAQYACQLAAARVRCGSTSR
eukprot:gnl/Chilomastix_cuspidata/4362.p1 GENE.gnl/Chilomastix_cuspidata/4362~~gnl/Chilomastix_cuspidata/4362.p1  ORF type:complete len:582 (+),score=143.63 gnl/Chilomastix_cuspidata/4362:238-1746(+)